MGNMLLGKRIIRRFILKNALTNIETRNLVAFCEGSVHRSTGPDSKKIILSVILSTLIG